jgi:hypothetical protein
VARESGWLSYDAASRRISITVHVQPNARRAEIAGLYGDALKIKVAAPAVDNRANAALVEFLGEALGVPRSAIVIRHGATGRRKVLDITGGPELLTKLGKLE